MKRTGTGADFIRYALGDRTVIALRDGHVDMPPERLRRQDGQAFGPDLPPEVPLLDGRLRLSVNAFLILGDGPSVLIDTGSADAWEPTMGRLLGALAEAGVARGSIGTVAFTHTHTDHVAGLVAPDGSDAFPNLAALYVPEQEMALFERRERVARFHSRATPFGDGAAIGDRIAAVAAPGHEIGHSAFAVTGGSETLLVWGDAVHVPSIQFARPELTWEFDADQGKARATRMQLLDRAARPDTFIAGAHLDFPGVGRVTREGPAYRFIPV